MSCKICKMENTKNFEMSYITLNNNKKPSLICHECLKNDKILRCVNHCNFFTCSDKPHKKKEHNYKPYNYYVNKLK